MSKIKIKGVIVSNDDQMVYDFFGIEATSPSMVEQAISEAKDGDLEVEISSGGGSVYAGSDIYTALKQHKGNVTTRVTGIAASAASVIAMAGKTVEISPIAQIMIHNVSSLARGDYRDLAHESEVVKNYNKTIANAYRLKTGMEEKAILDMMNKETWLTAQQAKEMGFADSIMFDDSGQLDLIASLGSEMIPRAVIENMRNQIKSQPKEADFLISKNSPTGQEEPETMTKDEYTEQKTALLDNTEAIEALDNKFEIEAKELANEAALKDTRTITNLETKSIAIKEAKTVELMNESKANIITADSPEYRVAFLKNLQGKKLTQLENEYTVSPNTAAGVVPTSTAAMIFDTMTTIAPMLNEIQLLRVPGNLRFAVQGTRNAAAVHVEGAPITPDADTIVSVVLGGFEFTKVVRISATVQAMGIDAFEAWIVKIIAEELAVIIDNEIINSPHTTGGISDGPAGGWVNGTSQITYVPGVGLTNANILALMALLPSAYHFNAKWLMNNATFFTQVLAMEDANGEPLHKNAIAADGVKRIYGKEVLIDDNVAANEGYFGDFKKVVGNLSSDISIARSAESGFLNNSIDFRGTAIFDCDVADPSAIVKLNV